MLFRIGLMSTALILSGLAAGCASEGPPPSEQVTRARTMIEAADKAGVQRYAAADLQRAHDELSDAEKANAAGRYDEARRDAESASVDADLATARGSAGDAERAAHEVDVANETLRQESNRSAVINSNPQ